MSFEGQQVYSCQKLFLLILLTTFSMAIAREFYVEKAINVKLKTGEIVKAAQRLDEKAEIVIESGGRLMFVDQQSKNRWLVQKKYKGIKDFLCNLKFPTKI